MATEHAAPVNGNYAPHTYGMSEQSYAHSASNSVATSEFTPANGSATANNDATGEIPKDEVGWYFVEQYYTTLSKSPEKLFLFYNKRSQYVSGTESEKVLTCVGQKAINDRIKELDIQDCKVRVTNVDSQGSGQNIVIQVIGEISDKSAPLKKFVQTFVLAEQTNGYFVLNDIFRYIAEEEDELEGETGTSNAGFQEPAKVEPETLPSTESATQREAAASVVDSKLETEAKKKDENVEQTAQQPVEAPAGAVNGEPSPAANETIEAEDAPAAAPLTEEEPKAAAPLEETKEIEAGEAVTQTEEPKSAVPTPTAASPKSTAGKSTAPKTWANLVAGSRVALPASASSSVPQASATVAAAPAQPKAAAPAPTPTPTQAATAPTTAESEQPGTPVSSGSEWQTARGHDHGKKQSRAQAAPAAVLVDNSRGYIKNVGEGVDQSSLRAALSKIAEITYLDINRAKNCAFVDFASADGYKAAVAANPHEVDGERIYVEERRVKPNFGNAFPRGGGANRGRGGQEGRGGGQGRGGFQGGEGRGRGSFARGGRGGNAGGRGRGGPPQAA